MKLIAMIAIDVVAGIFIIAHVVRSIILKRFIVENVTKMYLAVFLGMIVSNLALAEVLTTEVLTTLIGAVVGGALGMHGAEKKED